MCELTEVNYLDGDIVWVKLGPCWWPGEVWGESRLPEDALQGFKKLPVAVVKFFQEESYEYVKNVSNIYKYNCSKKDEFIKKGLDKFRAKNSFMEKFPADLKKAEELTGGDPDIAENSKFAPSPKVNYNEIFGTPIQKKKKTLKASSVSPKVAKLKSQAMKKGKSASMLTSPITPNKTPKKGRFSDFTGALYETPEDTSNSKYSCYVCGFTSNRLNVIVLHSKQHSANTCTSFARTDEDDRYSLNDTFNASLSSVYNQTPTKVTGISRTSTIQDDLKIIRNSELAEKKEKEKTTPKGKQGASPIKGKKRGRPPLKKQDAETEAKKVKTDHEIKTKLLADWSDDQDSETEDSNKIVENSVTEESNKIVQNSVSEDSKKIVENSITEDSNKIVESTITEEEVDKIVDEKPIDENNVESPSPLLTESRTNSVDKSEDEMKSKSCFDFEEDDVIDVVPKSPGRKIPRLITKKTKKEFEYTLEPHVVSPEAKPAEPEEQETPTNSNADELVENKDDDDDSKKLDIDISDILSATKPPELPEIPNDKFNKEPGGATKPVREIMSPKERGKRIFKSKQIFKTRMQEKYDDLKTSDDVLPDSDQSVKADLIALVEKSVSQQIDKDSEPICESNSMNEPVEVLQIISEIDTPLLNTNKEPDTESIEMTSDKTEEPEQNFTLYNITDESLNANNNKTEIVPVTKSPYKRRKSRHSTTDSLVSKSPIKEILESELKSPSEPIIEEAQSKSENNLDSILNTETEIQETPKSEEKITEESVTKSESEEENITPPKKKKKNSTLNDAECLMNFSDSVYTEKEKTVEHDEKSPQKLNDITLESITPVKTPVHFGFGSLDTTEPLKSEELKLADTEIESETIQDLAENTEKLNDTESSEVKEENTFQPESDIQSYITGKSNLDSKIVASSDLKTNSRLRDVLTEPQTVASTTEMIKTETIFSADSSSESLIKQKGPKKQFVIKMKNENKDTNAGLLKSAIDQIEDIETFIIEKPKQTPISEVPASPKPKTEIKIVKRQSPKKPSIISSSSKRISQTKPVVQEDPVFDINSMPIVLSDELITAENLDQMSLVLSKNMTPGDTNMIIDNNLIIVDQKQENKIESKPTARTTTKVLNQIDKPLSKLPVQKPAAAVPMTARNQRIYQSPSKSRLKNNTTVLTQPGKPGKFIVIPSSTAATGTKYTVGKRLHQKSVKTPIETTPTQLKLTKSATPGQSSKPIAITSKVVHQKVNIDSSGNTILFITNSNGEQSKVVLTPDQKLPGIKSSVTPQTIVTSKGAIINPKQSSAIVTTSKPNQQLILTSKGQIISSSVRNLQTAATKQKSISSNIAQTILTSKGQIIAPGQILTSTGQLIQTNQQKLVVSKGNILTPLTPNQMKKLRNQTPTQKIIINKRGGNIVVQQPQHTTKERIVLNKSMQSVTEKPKTVPKKGFVRLSTQQLADMEKLGFVEETDHGKIITQEGIRHMQALNREKVTKIQSTSPTLKKVRSNTNLKKLMVPGSIDHNVTPKRNLSKTQPALPPLTPIGESKIGQTEIVYQKLQEPIVQPTQTITEQLVTPPKLDLPSEETQASDVTPQATTEPTLSALPDAQLLAVPGETFGGPPSSFYLCSVEDNGNLTPIDNQPLYLDANNQLVPATNLPETLPAPEEPAITTPVPDATLATPMSEIDQSIPPAQMDLSLSDLENQQIIINADGQQFILDQQSLLALTEQQILTTDGQQLILQGNAQQILAVLAANQEATMLEDNLSASVSYQHEFGNKDILATALANTNVFQNESTNPDLDIYQNLQTDYKHSSVSETSTALSQPIMSPLELPSNKKSDENEKIEGMTFNQNIDDSLAVIGVNSTNVPTSLDLPITITNPKIAPKSTNPLNMACEMIYQTSSYSPVTSKEELASTDIFQPTEISLNDQILQSADVVTTLSMPDLTGDISEQKVIPNIIESDTSTFPTESMPLLNDDIETPMVTDSKVDETLNTKNIEYSENLPAEIVSSEKSENTEETCIDDVNKCDTTEDMNQLLDIRPTSTECTNDESKNVPTSIENSFDMLNIATDSSSKVTQNILNTDSCPTVDTDSKLVDSNTVSTKSTNEVSNELESSQLIEHTDNIIEKSEPTTTETLNNGDTETQSNENERSELVSTPITSEINIITENLHFGSENSDILTPDTIPETIVASPRSTHQDFCESSNSCEIPIQPNLVYDQSQENKNEEGLVNNKSEHNEEVAENKNEELRNDVDPDQNLFDFDQR